MKCLDKRIGQDDKDS